VVESAGAGEGGALMLPTCISVAMLVGSVRDCVCLRKLLEDVGDGEAPKAVNKSDSFRGVVVLPPAMGRSLSGGDFASMGIGKVQERSGRDVDD